MKDVVLNVNIYSSRPGQGFHSSFCSTCWDSVASQEALSYYLIEQGIISIIFSRKSTQLFCFNVKHSGCFLSE